MTCRGANCNKINNSNTNVYSITIYMQNSIFYNKTAKIYSEHLLSTVRSRQSMVLTYFTELNGFLNYVAITNTV